MGIGDKLKQGAEATRQKIEDGRQVRREAEAAAAAEAAERERETTGRRHVLHATLSATCPLTMTAEQAKLPGGLTLFDDEFLVAVGKD